jgi:aspartyl/asparaginyl beta-hydroxylase (cupin superfamily)
MYYINLLSNVEWMLLCISTMPLVHKILYLVNNNITNSIGNYITDLDNSYNMLHYLSITYLILILLFLYRLWNDTSDIYMKIIITIGIIVYLKNELLTIMNTWNKFLNMITTNPSININKKFFPGHINFEKKEQFNKIRKEVLHISSNNQLMCLTDLIPTNQYIAADRTNGNCWKWKSLKYNGKPDNILNDYPILKEALMDNMIANCGISMLEPHVSIPLHRGYFKGYLRYHICIETNDNDVNKPYIICGGIKYVWKTGEGVLFDDMFLHEVVNKSDSRRIVLYLDIIRQDLPEFILNLNNMMAKLINENVLINKFVKKQHTQISNL